GNERSRDVSLKLPPGQRVLRLTISVWPPEVGPVGEPVRPIGQAPFAVEVLDGAVSAPQRIDELLEYLIVGEDLDAGFIVDLVADDGGMLCVAGNNLANDPLCVE